MYRYFAFALLFLLGCQSKTDCEITKLQTETENIHDEAMKDLASMNRKGREIKKMMEVARLTEEANKAYLDTLGSMNKAETDMYDWMRNYKPPTKDAPNAKAYLLEQKAKIQANADHIRSLIQ
jgi:hypothetical protein